MTNIDRQLLGRARRLADAIAGTDTDHEFRHVIGDIRASAEKLAQDIVDEIGHPVTDEPALGPRLRERVAELEAMLTGDPAVTDLRREVEKLADALRGCLTHLARHAESNAALHCSDRVMYSPLHAKVESAIVGAEHALARTGAQFAEDDEVGR